MESQQKLVDRIKTIMQQMTKNYPELCECLSDAPLNVSDNKPLANNQDLKKYHDSLIQILKKYIP